MSTIIDGGPAFPAQPIYKFPDGAVVSLDQGGMTLRDYFAGQALAAMPDVILTGEPDSVVAKVSYKLADAMLAEREEKP